MRLAPFNFDARRSTAIIVGAGATRGASFVSDEALVKPPLDDDFFRMLRASSLARDQEARKLLQFVDDEFGALDIGMETFYSQSFMHNQFVAQIPSSKVGRRKDYAQRLKYFRSLLPRLFKEAIPDQECISHGALVSHADATDVFISFNYDCTLDRALAKKGGRRWNPGNGYGFSVGFGTEGWRDHSGRGRLPKQGLRLLKPHGSLNWTKGDGGFGLRQDPYDQRNDSDLHIVAPLWQKTFDEDPPYKDIWAQARKVLTSVKALLIVGYSLPETDVYTQALLRIDVGSLDFLGIVNPDRAARARIRSTLRSSITPATHLVEIETLKQLGALLSS